MRDVLRSCGSMLRLAWAQSPAKTLTAAVLTVASGLAWPVVALALKASVDAVEAHDVRAATLAGAAAGVGVIAVLVLRHFAFTSYVEVTEAGVVDVEAELMGLANGSPGLEHHERADYADTVSVIQRELSGMQEGMGALLQMVSLTVTLGVTGAILASVNPYLLLLLVMAVPSVLAMQRAARMLDDGTVRAAEPLRQTDHLLQLSTTAASAKELRVLRLRHELQRRHAVSWDRAGRILMRSERRATALSTAGQLLFSVAYVVSVLVVVRQAVSGRSAVGDVVLVMALAAQLNTTVYDSLNELRNLQRVSFGFGRLRRLRALVAAPEPATSAPVPSRIDTAIELRGVTFTYPGTERPVLEDVDLVLPAGSIVAVVGENGAGKSTLVKLLCRFYEPTAGAITVDGVDLRELPVAAWRERISAAFQDFLRLEVTAQETVGVGDLPRIHDEPAVVDALARAHATDVVGVLDTGLTTQLGKSWTDGSELSGGQWQKLALGRSMMRSSPLLLVLDEPTAALDAEAEHALFARYAAEARRVGASTGAVTVLVSHRFSTVRMADLIVVLTDGGLAETGTHDQLVAAGGLYADLYGVHERAYASER